MNIVCVGGGPAGLYFALLARLRDPLNSVTVFERNRSGETFGWGVVLSDAALDTLAQADAPSAAAIRAVFKRCDAIDIHVKGRTVTWGGHGFCGIGRRRLLAILEQRCRELGVAMHHEREIGDVAALARADAADMIVAADGVHGALRRQFADSFRPELEQRHCRFVWLGTRKRFDTFTFVFENTPHGWFQAHAYRYDEEMSTFIVETPDETWRASGLADMNSEQALAFCERLFARYLDGEPLLAQAGQGRGAANWMRFPRLVCRRWVQGLPVDGRRVPLVLMGDAAHTAHFSIGSGTRLALEDAIALAEALGGASDADEPDLERYQQARQVEVLKLQSAARNSMEWLENVARYGDFAPEQFAHSLLTRSQRLSHENLRLRDDAYVAGFERWLVARAAGQAGVECLDPAPPPMFTPYRVRSLLLKNRLVVSPMAQYSAVDGLMGDYHLAHLGARALGGAALVMAEMTCVSADARITPGCPGLYAPQHTAHGYLLSSVVSPLTNQRTDLYGGSLAARCRYPLEVFAAVRAVWPQELPMSVRISSHDWVEGGITPQDAVAVARLSRDAGADMIDCSSGQVSKQEHPVFGRMYQAPFADCIRNEAGIATIAVGAITDADQVNGIIAAGRADLCAVGRPHLANPAWTLSEAARIGWHGVAWPRQYLAGKAQLERNLERERLQAAAPDH